MALEVVGGAFASALFQTLFEKMASPEVLAFFRKTKLDQRELRTLLLTADRVLDDAEDKQLTDPLVRQWLRDLKDATFDVEDLLAEICDDALQRKMEGESASAARKVIRLMKTLSCCTAIKKRVELKKDEVLDRLKLVLEQKDVFGFRESVVTSSVSQRTVVTSLVEESGIYGRDAEKRKIVELLLSDDVGGDKISVIPIVGMGGTGKTTLAALVYKNEEVKKHFEVMAWVTVSDKFDVARITKAILDRVVTSGACDAGDLDRLQVKLNEALKEKRFLFVLDDIWEENYEKWDGLRRAFESGAKGSKIIVTTRNEKIASMMASAGVSPHQLHTISKEDCLQLFVNHAFNSSVALGSDPNLERICEKIVERCKGLPLAVKSLAGLLRSEPQAEWEKILQSGIWALPSEKVEIIPALWLSYHYLHPHLKRCFAYCAIFPHDYAFGKQELVLLWMGENLLPLQNGKRPEDIGEEYFNDLLSRSMFQRSPEYSTEFNMHDLVCDLAKYVFGQFCASLEANACNTSATEFTRYLSSGKETTWDVKKYEALSRAKCLRTFLALPNLNEQFSRGFISMDLPLYDTLQPKSLFNVLSLRVLSLSEYPSTELPDSIGDLKHLRYLNLSFSKLERLPDTLCNLYNLQILLFMCCENLSQLPANTGSLTNLRHLDVTETPLKDMPENLGNLKNLQFLSDFVVGEKSGPNIKELEKLHHLHRSLHISRLDDAGEGCRNSRLLPSLGQLVYLEELEIRRLRDVVKIGGEFFDNASSSVSVPFRSLTTLHFELMSRWNEWSFSRRNGEDGVFPSLTSLQIWSCHQLVKLLSGSPQHETHTPFPCLKYMDLYDCPKLESFLEWGSFSTLVSIHIHNCEKLFQLRAQWNLQRFTSLKQLRLWNCDDAMDSFPEEGLLPTTLTSLFIYCFRNLTALNGKGLQQLTSLEALWIVDCMKLECLPEGLPSSLSDLDIYGCPSLTARCQREEGEDWSKIAHISHVTINRRSI